MCPGRVLAAETRDGLQEEGATTETSRYVAEPLRLKTKVHPSVFSLSVDNTGEGRDLCSMNTLAPLCACMTSARHPATCLRATPPPYRHPEQ